jgi:hypothetical protein
MIRDQIWKAWLRLNQLTKEVPTDYVAEVATTGKSLRNEDIARMLKNEGSELHLQTLIDILNHSDELRCERIQQGFSVQTGICHITPRITGNWPDSSQPFDPKKHKITCDFTSTAELRKALEAVTVEVQGVRDSGARIGLVTDITSGKTDGTLTVDGEIIITGEKIKIEPLNKEGIGVMFMDAYGGTSPVHTPLIQNDPKKVICRVPALETGTYMLHIVTQFSQAATLLKQPRTIVYELPLVVL